MARTQGGGVQRLGVVLQPGDEARHVRALLLGRQRDVQRPQRRRRLHGTGHAQLQRIAHVLHAHALDHEVALVALALRVGDVKGVGQVRHQGAKDRTVGRLLPSQGLHDGVRIR